LVSDVLTGFAVTGVRTVEVAVAPFENGASKYGITEDGVSKDWNTKDGVIEDRITEDRTTEEGIAGDEATKDGFTEGKTCEVRISEDGVSEVGIAKDGDTDDGVAEVGIANDGVMGTCGSGVIRTMEVVVMVDLAAAVCSAVINGSRSCSVGVAVIWVADVTGWNGKDNEQLFNASSTGCNRFGASPDQDTFEIPVSLVSRRLYSLSNCGCMGVIPEGGCCTAVTAGTDETLRLVVASVRVELKA
jgi:hypothetical protein